MFNRLTLLPILVLLGTIPAWTRLPAAGVGPARPLSGPLPIQTPAPDPGLTPVPEPSQTPTPAPGSQPGIITQIFKVVFSAETLSEALAEALAETAEQEAGNLEAQTAHVAALIGEILNPPGPGKYAEIAGSTLTTAAALAPALFLVRLVLYHWSRLVDEEDGLLRVFGDWLAAGFLAVSAGQFLDAVVQAGWWMAGAAVGETLTLASQFVSATMVTGELSHLLDSPGATMFAGLLAIGAGLGGLIGVVGLAAAFAVAQAVLFVLAVIAPAVAVLAVVPQMRWLRGLWLKAVAVLALLPVAAGAIFKAGVALTAYFGGGGLADILVRLFWLWGAVGFLLSLAGILGKVTLSAAVDATAKLGRGTRRIVSTAAMALGGAPVAAGAAGVGAGPGSTTPPGSASGQTGTGSFAEQPGAPQYVREQSFTAGPPAGLPQGGSRPPKTAVSLQPGRLEAYFTAAGLDLGSATAQFPEEVAAMERSLAERAGEIAAHPQPLAEAARLAGADRIAAQIAAGDRGSPA